MATSLGEWGVCRGENRTHTKFYDDRMKEVVEYFQADSSKRKDEWIELMEELAKTRLPVNCKQAVRHVLSDDVDVDDDEIYYDTEDKLNMSFSPYYLRCDQRTKRSEFKIKYDFRKFRKRDLDPFQRFNEVEYRAFEWFHCIWFGEAKESLQGTVFEALLAHYLETTMPCYCCKHRNCLRWNGGWGTLSSWADMVCCRVECQALYEIKSKRSDEAIEKGFGYSRFQGGSFRTYYSHPSPGKRYVVLVSRSETLINQRMVHRVSIAEIECVVPKLCSDSFVGTGHVCRIVSNIVPRKASIKKQWCLLPACKEPYTRIAQDVYMERFGQNAWLLLQSTNDAESIETNKDSEKNELLEKQSSELFQKQREKQHAKDLAKLKSELEDLKLGSKKSDASEDDLDDWENMYSDEE